MKNNSIKFDHNEFRYIIRTVASFRDILAQLFAQLLNYFESLTISFDNLPPNFLNETTN